MLLASCDISSKIQGKWYVMDAAGDTIELEFTKNKVIIGGEGYEIKQSRIGIMNGIKYVGIEQGGKTYSIIFSDKKDGDVAILLLPSDEDNLLYGKMVYAMNRNEIPNYSEYATKYLNVPKK